MDCGPSLGVLTLNALAAANEVFIPLQPHFLALHGLGKLLETTALVAKRINPALKVTGIVAVPVRVERPGWRRKWCSDLEEFLEQRRGDATRRGPRRGSSRRRIRRNIKLAECPSFGQSIFAYAPTCNGAEDYAGAGPRGARRAGADGAGGAGAASRRPGRSAWSTGRSRRRSGERGSVGRVRAEASLTGEPCRSSSVPQPWHSSPPQRLPAIRGEAEMGLKGIATWTSLPPL